MGTGISTLVSDTDAWSSHLSLVHLTNAFNSPWPDRLKIRPQTGERDTHSVGRGDGETGVGCSFPLPLKVCSNHILLPRFNRNVSSFKTTNGIGGNDWGVSGNMNRQTTCLDY
jgi:hypothetical protein